jgi:lipopolysaccharide biosynthesis glycosyltransferase
MRTLSVTINEQTKAGNSLLSFLNSLDFVTIHEIEDNIPSGKQAAMDCNAVPLESFISELHNRVDSHFAFDK